MKIIGLTGSIAMGKTEVAKVFQDEGIPVFDADREVHALYDSAEGVALLKQLAPEAIVNQRVDRQLLSAAVMADKGLLARLEKVVHTVVGDRRKTFLDEARRKGHRLAVVDVPLLFEKGYDKDVDLTIVVSAPEAQQRKRALARPGMTPEKLDMILSRQMSDAEKRKHATIVIENNGTLEDLRQKTGAVIQKLKETA